MKMAEGRADPRRSTSRGVRAVARIKKMAEGRADPRRNTSRGVRAAARIKKAASIICVYPCSSVVPSLILRALRACGGEPVFPGPLSAEGCEYEAICRLDDALRWLNRVARRTPDES